MLIDKKLRLLHDVTSALWINLLSAEAMRAPRPPSIPPHSRADTPLRVRMRCDMHLDCCVPLVCAYAVTSP